MTEPVPRRILVVDDDEQVRTLLRNLLEREGYLVSIAANGSELRQRIEREPVDLITLDLNLGPEDGLSLAREIRAKRNVPIVMITAKDSDVDRVVGLELGADDYIVKPFNLREVLARVRAVLRRYEPPVMSRTKTGSGGNETFSFAGWVLDVTSRELTAQEQQRVELTTAEFNLLEVFVRRPSRVLSRDAIMDLLKGHDWSPVDRSIDMLVGRLRKKIEKDCDKPSLIKTVRGVGYVFTADVARS